jgi:capsular polysaccharide export protein
MDRVNNLNIDDLVDVHIRRKEVRHPVLKKVTVFNRIVRKFYIFRERARASYYFSLFESHPCETGIMWNGMKQPNRTPYVVAKAAGKKTQLFENGLLPNTTTLDMNGVNAFNSVPRDAEFYRAWTGEVKAEEKQLVARAAHKQRKTSNTLVALPERYVFVPFQVPNDTQVVCHSPWITGMEAFYEALELALTALKQEPKWQEFKFVIKEHPSWPRSFEQLHHSNPDIVFANDNNTQELIENALAVVTINSTVGIESLLLDKSVITLGNAFFNIEGLVHHCSDQQTLNETLLSIEQQQVDLDLVHRFLSYLKMEYLLPQSWSNISDETEHFNAVKKRLVNPYTSDCLER